MSNDYNYQTPTYFLELDTLGNNNIAWGINNLELFKQHNIKVLFPIAFFFRDQTTSPAGRFKLLPNWEEYFANERQKIDPYLDNIYGFYQDEPFWNGATRDDFHTYSRAIREAYPDKALMIYEAAPSVNGSHWENSIPSDYYKYVTDFGFDYYFTLESSNNVDGWGKYLDYFEKFKPHLKDKNLRFAPDGYGPPNYASRWGDAYERYLSLAQTTPNTIGMLGFIYNLPSELRTGNIGLSNILDPTSSYFDPNFRTRQIEIGKGIINSNSILYKAGDLNTDGNVNIFDFNLLISKFGNHYTIFDFNAIVSNYGK